MHQAIGLAPDSSDLKASLVEVLSDIESDKKLQELNDSAAQLMEHFEQSRDWTAFNDAIQLMEELNKLTPDGHTEKAKSLSILGNAFSYRFEHLGKLEDIENAILVKRQAVDLTPDGNADKAAWLNDIGKAFLSRFEHLGELGDMENAILVNQQAVDLTPDDHPHKPVRLSSLGDAFVHQFGCLGKLEDIENAILVNKQAVDLTPDGHAHKAARLNMLGNAFFHRFERLGEHRDIENAILFNQQAVNLTPDGHANKAARLNNLGATFFRQFERLGDLKDIENAIRVIRQAVDLTPDGHDDKARQLGNLGNALLRRFEHLGELRDMGDAILFNKQAVDLTPDSHAQKATRLNNLGNAFFRRFEHLGELGDIDNAILLNQHAVDLTPNDHAEKAVWLNSLGNALFRRYRRLGELGDIKNAICFHQQAVDLTPDGHARKAALLNNLGADFVYRFEHFHEYGDMEEGEESIDRNRLMENAILFNQQAIFFTQQAVNLTPDGHADKARLLSNLGNTLQGQFKLLGKPEDMENAICFNQRAVDLTPDVHADKPEWLNSLGAAFKCRFEHLGELRDVENEIFVMQQAVNLTPDGHANKARQLKNLGDALVRRFECLHEHGDIMGATVAYKQATENTSSHPVTRYDAACRWADLCSKHQSPSLALDAYTVAMEMIPQVVWFGQKVHHRYKELPKIGRTINAAAAMAISVKDLQRAVEWLEEGRSIVWKQILQLRTPLDELHQQYPDLANDLSQVSLALYDVGTSRSWNIDSEIKHKGAEEEAQFHRRLAAHYEQLLQQIRELDGFGSFLRPKKFSELAPAARNGPVVIVNVHDSGCDALVVCPSTNIIHVPLPMFSYGEAAKMHSVLIASLRAGGVRDRETFANLINYEVSTLVLKEILGQLWVLIAHPILSLYENTHDSLPHITWCATGAFTFLPLHAAGIYGSDDPTKNVDISDFAVSSYTTTLTAMLGSGSKPKQDPTKTPNVLIVSQLGTAEEGTLLPSVVKEVEVIQSYTSPDHTCHLTNEMATVGAVWGEMSKYEIIHFACHGIQDIKNPLNSAFALYDGRLDLNTLMRLSLENAELAVLSACETATGEEKLPEEAVHLAAGMLAIGYPSVIATMWSICDPDAPLIADEVYANLLGCRDNSESQKAKLTPAYALYEAVKHLRREVGEMNFVRWVPFIHLGV
ncbi:TPR-like protein [Dendrothele bispora CBS 962.96]|uniref:TPR-like protein n=1 Tax=Dendrothele bispora (strain CBS 962.96) TaxID=1314807 RepID=A0A4S8LHV7_DENBC|nr:TPR-like protein [Dendrothele bispora CBS 962.96]